MQDDIEYLELPNDPHIGRDDKLAYGQYLKFTHQVYSQQPEPEMLALSAEQIKLRIEESMDAEKQIALGLAESMKKWEAQAANTQKLKGALKYLQTPEVRHSSNMWQESPYREGTEQISNRVYKMSCTLRKNHSWSRSMQAYQEKWEASWNIGLNLPQDYFYPIDGQENKKYDTQEAAVKYLEGRKKAYAHLFQEISPPIPQKYAQGFMVSGHLLPGYTVGGQEPEVQPIQERSKAQQSFSVDLGGQPMTVRAGSLREAALKALEQLDAQAQAAPPNQAQQPQQTPTEPKLSL